MKFLKFSAFFLPLLFTCCNNIDDPLLSISQKNATSNNIIQNESLTLCDSVLHITSIEEFNALLSSFTVDDQIFSDTVNEIMPFASLVDMTYNGTQSRTIISENVITTFDFQTAQRIGVTANTKYYVSFYRANVVVNHPEAITYMQKDSPSCGIRPDKENWSTDFGYAGSISNGKFYMYSNVALINKEVGAAKELNKWYPRAPANLIWLYRIYTN